MTRRIYRPPSPDEPLDDVQLSLAHALAKKIERLIREQLQQAGDDDNGTHPALTDSQHTANLPAGRHDAAQHPDKPAHQEEPPMTMIAKYPRKTFVPCPEGQYQACCVDVVNLGIDPTYGSERLRFVFQTAEIDVTTGRRFDVAMFCNNTLGPKSNLRQMLTNWYGRPLPETELQQFDLDTLIGRNAIITVEHSTKMTGERYAKLTTLAPCPADRPPLVPVGYVRAKDRPNATATTTTTTKPVIAQSRKPTAAPLADLDTPMPTADAAPHVDADPDAPFDANEEIPF
jgi:hypothetical protein